jgi:hypothetical protein
MSVIGSNILAGASGQGGDYTIARSLRFRSSASAYLSRTPATTTNRKTWTWSAWVKRGDLSRRQWLLQQSDTAGDRQIQLEINAGNAIRFGWYDVGVGSGFIITNALYRDPSAWYHIMYSVDTTQATDTNRVKIYVNGSQVTSLDGGSTYPPQNFDTSVNTTNPMSLGASITPSLFFDGYLAEVNFIDGQALTPSSFGATNAATGVWQPKKYAGTYGTNGFYLPFSNNSTTTTLGSDFSGNGNNWTTNNISLTAGSTYDSMTDVPTLTSATVANYATFNPLNNFAGAFSANPTISQANLLASGVADTKQYYCDSTIQVSSGKWYAEFTPSGVTGDSSYVGIVTDSYLALYAPTGNYYNNSSFASYGATYTTNDVIGVAYDATNGTIEFYKNGTSQGQKTGITGSNAKFRTSSYNTGASHSWTANFGQRPFAYTPPTGFVALNTFNLPTPTIGATASTQANKYFDISLWTGDGNSTRTISGLGFQPDFVWAKQRNIAQSHSLWDSVRGTGKLLESNATGAESTSTVYGQITSFNSDGFTGSKGSDPTFSYLNQNTGTYVGWQWKANGTGSTNTAGSITSTVSANTSAGFSVVTYTGTGSNATVGHGLGVAPSMIIVKTRNISQNWIVYHSTLGKDKLLYLNNTDTAITNSDYWGTGGVTSTVFGLKGGGFSHNLSSQPYVAYCFSEVAGYSKFGSYTGNGSSDGPFIFTGFRPAFLLTKRSSVGGTEWFIYDTKRETYNYVSRPMRANDSSAELGVEPTIAYDILSNGFKVRTTGTAVNSNGETYIYAAFAENPFKYSLAR